MIVIPAIDIMDKTVVRAISGDRDKYRPLKSNLCPDSEPKKLIIKFNKLGFNDVYVADLNGILYRKYDISLYTDLSRYCRILLDAGIRNLGNYIKIYSSGISKVVVATETLNDLSVIEEIISFNMGDKLITSLDIKNSAILSISRDIRKRSPYEILKNFYDYGVRRSLIIDLDRVGTMKGLDVNLLNKLRKVDMELFYGGGIKDLNDLRQLRSLGYDGALISTALHMGNVSVEQLISENFI